MLIAKYKKKPLEWLPHKVSYLTTSCEDFKMKGGDPAARSRTATLLRLSANHKVHRVPTNVGIQVPPIFSA